MVVRAVALWSALLPALAGVAPAASLTEQRLMALNVVAHHVHACSSNGGEWHSTVVAFPVGRADRVYLFSEGAGSAFRLAAGRARLVWCGLAVAQTASWAPRSNVERALRFPLKTVAGRVPPEGALDIFSESGGRLWTLRQTVDGAVTCRARHDLDGMPRTAFQLTARDTCP